MSTAPAPAANQSAATSAPQMADAQNGAQSGNGDLVPVSWDSEIQLVSSLAKLQELERKIHELRAILPQGLLEPLVPISNPDKATADNTISSSPRHLLNDLNQTARARIADVEQFQSMWRGPELKPVWAHVESRISESNGQLLQSTGKWEKDYDELRDELLKEEREKEEQRLREEEDIERVKAQSTEGQWQAVLDRFIQRDVPGVRVIKGQDQMEMTVALTRAGIFFLVHGSSEPGEAAVSDWQVSSKVASGKSRTKLEDAILDCLGSRPRKWDLAFLLDMIASYADIKQTPCIKCQRLTNNAAQLPTLRRAQPLHPTSEPRIFNFDALHSTCA
ncbi:hypothetical protein N7474_010750 [Penicillium riverlandense]|uniref:uncharacterized protein n=1 Tax=Penicillium riverlandense TaxID=1903569 RepID=UPI0025476588|nr:uncharacterized protein N7474_010750 [Penicillium riverlandense]KAJ5804863.1 hypothetical protein N7474_010750 [Penicillium riverlandense]